MTLLKPLVNYVYLVLLISALSLIQFLIGGTRLLFAYPSYWILGICGVLSLASAFRPRKERPHSWCLLASLAFFGYILARASLSPIEFLARPDFFMVLGCLLVYFLTAFYLTTTRDRLIVIGSLFILAVAHIWVGTIQFTKNSQFLLFGMIRNDFSFRASGLFVSGNHMSGFLEAVAIIGLAMVWWSRWPVWAKIVVGYLSAACYFGVGISASRGGMLSSAFSLVVLSVLGLVAIRKIDRSKFARALAIWVGIAVIGVGTVSFLALRSSLIKSRLNQQHTADVRIYNWQATLDQFRVAPLFGTGAGTHLYYGRLFRRPQIQSDPVHAHGDYLELLSEYGVVGAIGLSLFLAAHLFSGFKAFNFLTRRLRDAYVPRSNTLALNIGVLCAVFGLMAHSVVDFNMHIPGNALVFAFFFGILTNPGIATQRELASLERWVAGLRFALPALGVAVCLWSIPKFPGEYFTEKSRIALRDKRYLEAIALGNRATGDQVDENFWLDRWNKRFGGEKKNPFIYFYIGEANRMVGKQMFNKIMRRSYYKPAVEAYQKSLQIFPEDENTLVRMGQCYDGLEQFTEAEQAYTKAIHADPNLAILYEYYAAHLKLRGKNADLSRISAKAKELAKDKVMESGTTELMSN